MSDLRSRLVELALQWQERFGVAPAITGAISEFDAAMMVGLTEEDYCQGCSARTAVTRGHDFIHDGHRYQVKANRPSGKPGSPVTLVGKAKNYDWDRLVWILYDRAFTIQEAWLWTVGEYRDRFEETGRLSPHHMRIGTRLFPR
jgi:hypothetical protein